MKVLGRKVGTGKWIEREKRATSPRVVWGCQSEQRPGWSGGVHSACIRDWSLPDRGESHRSGPEMVQMFEVLQEPSARQPAELESSEQRQVVRYKEREVSRAGATWGSLCRAKRETLSYNCKESVCSPMPRTGEGRYARNQRC